MLNQGTVANPATTNLSDGAPVSVVVGRQGDQLASELHGKYYVPAQRGNLFNASTTAAGVAIVVSTTTVAGFGLLNPIGSGVRMELVSYNSAIQNASGTAVVSSVMLGLAGNLTVNPTGITSVTVNGGMVGGNNKPQGICFSQATISATASFFNVGAYQAVTGANPGCSYFFDGQLSLMPGSLAHVCGTAAQTNASSQTFVWVEWPL